MSKLLVKKQQKKEGSNFMAPNDSQLSDYKAWNEVLAKKFAVMYKNYRKFSLKHFGVDPFLQQDPSKAEEDKGQNGEPEADNENMASQVAKDENQGIN